MVIKQYLSDLLCINQERYNLIMFMHVSLHIFPFKEFKHVLPLAHALRMYDFRFFLKHLAALRVVLILLILHFRLLPCFRLH